MIFKLCVSLCVSERHAVFIMFFFLSVCHWQKFIHPDLPQDFACLLFTLWRFNFVFRRTLIIKYFAWDNIVQKHYSFTLTDSIKCCYCVIKSHTILCSRMSLSLYLSITISFKLNQYFFCEFNRIKYHFRFILILYPE